MYYNKYSGSQELYVMFPWWVKPLKMKSIERSSNKTRQKNAIPRTLSPFGWKVLSSYCQKNSLLLRLSTPSVLSRRLISQSPIPWCFSSIRRSMLTMIRCIIETWPVMATYLDEAFFENSQRLSAVNYFNKNSVLDVRYAWVLDTLLQSK